MHFIRPYLVAYFLLAYLLAGSLNARGEIIYRAKRGDSLTVIARTHGISLSTLAKRNSLRSTDRLTVGQRLIIPVTQKIPEDEEHNVYVVKSGDSLAEIANKFGVTVYALMQKNQIKQADRITVGQRLQIPGAPPKSDLGLRNDLRESLNKTAVASKRWKNIVIHHSGTQLDTLLSMDRYHRNERHMENGLAYHFVIGNGVRTGDGEIYIGQRWRKQLDGGHLSSLLQNRTSIGICLIGDFNKRAPSQKQIASARSLVAYLMNRCNLQKGNVKTHRQINSKPTECPGSKFPTQNFISSLP